MNYCCDDIRRQIEAGWTPGSHYHCGQCNEVTGMYGHYVSGHWDEKFRKTEGHFCCNREECTL